MRQTGHDVLWIRESAPGCADDEVIVRAHKESRLLITFDKDFGQLVFQWGANASHGVILLRISQASSATTADRVHAALEARDDWVGHFSVIDDFGIRMRVIPKRS